MKVSIDWLKELVDLNCSTHELISLLPLTSISIKDVTDSYIELDMKGYNRADLLSLRGVALEVSAITGSRLLFKEPDEANFVWNREKLSNTQVTVSNPEYAPFYTITKIEGLKVEQSPKEWVEKLETSGLRSINNVTDITNLIMLEYGQPMHAFDVSAVKDETIIVRTAKAGEHIITLDGKTRDLDSDLVIAGLISSLGIAGVMGGKDSEITGSTTTILLEAAIFDPVNIKKTTSRLNLPSEASKRFQHGLTKKRLYQALDAAIKMYQKLGGKVTAATLIGDFEDKQKNITLTSKKLEELTGVKFEDKKAEEYLERLSFQMEQAQGGWEVEIPYFRLDINIEEDLIEEVARMHGYEKIPSIKVSESNIQKEDPIFKKISDLKNKLVKLGLIEVQTYSFYTTDVLNALGFNENNKRILVRVANPISSETEYLRENIWPNLVEVAGRNLRKGYKQSLPSGEGKDIAIFEIGKIFSVGNGKPKEEYRLSIALYNNSENPSLELTQIAKKMDLDFKQSAPPKKDPILFHPKRFLVTESGALSEVHLKVLNKLGIEKRVAVLEIELT